MKVTFNIEQIMKEHNAYASKKSLDYAPLDIQLLKFPKDTYDTDIKIKSSEIKEFLSRIFHIHFNKEHVEKAHENKYKKIITASEKQEKIFQNCIIKSSNNETHLNLDTLKDSLTKYNFDQFLINKIREYVYEVTEDDEYDNNDADCARYYYCLRKVVNTTRGTDTELNLIQFKELILQDSFYRLITDKIQKFTIQNQNKNISDELELMYQELSHLQYQRYKEQKLLPQEEMYIESIANVLSITLNIPMYEGLLSYYEMFITYYNSDVSYYQESKEDDISIGQSDIREELIFDIISLRYTNQKANNQYLSLDNLKKIGPHQLIQNFFLDLHQKMNLQNQLLESKNTITLSEENGFIPSDK